MSQALVHADDLAELVFTDAVEGFEHRLMRPVLLDVHLVRVPLEVVLGVVDDRDRQVDRAARDLDVFAAKSIPPQTTRARLRGEFIKRAQERRRDFTVDWVHLKLNDQAQRTVLCKDPFRSHDERVQRLIDGM